MSYIELQVTTNFSFLRGGSHPEELVERAEKLGYAAMAVTDRNTLAGIVRAHGAARDTSLRFIPGCRLDLLDGPSLLAYPTDKAAYGRLSALLTEGNLRAEKGDCHIYKTDVYRYARGIRFIVLPPEELTPAFDIADEFKKQLQEYKDALGDSLYMAATRLYRGDDVKRLHRLSRMEVPLVATGDVHYHEPERRQLQDVLTCVREKCTIHTAGFRLHGNAERYLKPIDEMLRLFRPYPRLVERTLEIGEDCRFSLNQLQYVYPEEITGGDRTPLEELEHLTQIGARERYGEDVPELVVKNIRHEMSFIADMNYAPYFLTVYDIVRFARSQGILCQGRGSAANSTICYCLGITAVNPAKFDLLFERFISSARNEPPDIDVDFEHERREEVIQYIYQKYGRDRAAIVATVTQERFKGAIRDVGKAMGLSVDTISRLSKEGIEYLPDDKHLQKVMQLTEQLMGFPRQLGQHTGGFVITNGKLSDLCPILNARMADRTNIEWNKDDIDILGFLKIDVLALGMLTCIRKAFDLAQKHHNKYLTLANIPQDDPGVYEMISHADTLGVFQIESRAQMAMLPRLRPRNFYDLVIEVAIVRPGPIQGDMVHPYLRRRNGDEKVEYPSEELKTILHKTLGVPLFQEQAMKIAIVAAGFTPAEADQLRRSMATFKAQGQVTKFQKKLVDGMVANGYTEEYALRVFRQLEGFGSYGFPESHAASFALLVYVSAWLKCYYPDVFAGALLNSMPMGFYQPAQIVIDARKHGVTVLPVDVNLSDWDHTLEGKGILRLGFRQVSGLKEEEMRQLVQARGTGYTTVAGLRDIGVSQTGLEKLADADAFCSFGLDRRQALWQVSALHDRPIALFSGQPPEDSREKGITLPLMTDAEHVVQDYASTSLSLKAHPVRFVREKLDLLRVLSLSALTNAKDKDWVRVAGLVLVRQRPGTASGVVFMTIEDETGFANLVFWERVFEENHKVIVQSKLIMVEGRLQKEGEVIHVVVQKCHNLTRLLQQMVLPASRDFK
ncbi:MAG TPA: error-prone DNA polymerase [Dinghuibacter sp.]|uniref:error-prone DNA polymerase n=1 Tax=Dinghuibacter sp. TaxID=2024697 RepID=UPI002BF902CD|nr:error-prone DNA polymerase [Dinghuibacter sp.]HTJ13308.1 error-prone DNA polymerase [Dinghuibacter sp.]